MALKFAKNEYAAVRMTKQNTMRFAITKYFTGIFCLCS